MTDRLTPPGNLLDEPLRTGSPIPPTPGAIPPAQVLNGVPGYATWENPPGTGGGGTTPATGREYPLT
jgi:hypothetical protein